MDVKRVIYDLGVTIKESLSETITENDIRYAFLGKYNKKTIVIKAHSNSYSSVEHIKYVNDYIKMLGQIGVYSPKIIPFKNGLAIEKEVDGKVFIIWMEQYSSYKSVADYIEGNNYLKKMIFDKKEFEYKKVEFVSKFIKLYQDFDMDKPSPYTMFKPFTRESVTDDYEGFFLKLYNQTVGNQKIDQVVLEDVKVEFFSQRKEVLEFYNQLPTSVFQSDLNDTNLLIDPMYDIKGIMDYNLLGKEVVINYVINEVVYQELRRMGKRWIDEGYIMELMSKFQYAIYILEKKYRLTNIEFQHLKSLFRIIVPFKYIFLTDTIEYVNRLDYEEVNYRLLWMQRILKGQLLLTTEEHDYYNGIKYEDTSRRKLYEILKNI